MTKFRVAAKTFFLTYAQCDIPKDEIFQWLLRFEPTYRLVAAEAHADGGKHLHCVISFASKHDVKRADYFDYNNFHPNVQGARRPKETIAYCKKDGDWIEDGEPPFKRGWGEIATCMDKETFLSTVRSLYPRDYVLCYDRLLSYCESHFGNTSGPYRSDFTDFEIPEELSSWVSTEFKVSSGVNRRPRGVPPLAPLQKKKKKKKTGRGAPP